MVNIVLVALASLSSNFVYKGATEYVADTTIRFSHTLDFGTMYQGSTSRYTQTYLQEYAIDCKVHIPKEPVEGIYLYGFELTGVKIDLYQTSTGTKSFSHTYTADIDKSLTLSQLDGYIYITPRLAGTTMTWITTYYSPSLDDDIFSISAMGGYTTTTAIAPTIKYSWEIDTKTLYDSVSSFAKNYVNNDYNSGYQDGYNDGMLFGHNEGIQQYETGYDTGYNDGYGNGYDIGRNDGIQEGSQKGVTLRQLFWSVIDEPFAVIYRLLNFDVLGVNVFAFVTGLVTLGLIGFVIKMII